MLLLLLLLLGGRELSATRGGWQDCLHGWGGLAQTGRRAAGAAPGGSSAHRRAPGLPSAPPLPALSGPAGAPRA